MRESEKGKFLEIFSAVCLAHGKEITKPLIELYWRILCEYNFSDVSDAFERNLKNTENGQFFPKPSDIIREIEGDEDLKAVEAWDKAVKAISQYGSYRTVVFDDPCIHAAIDRLGGWQKFCMHTEKERPFIEKEFSRSYKVYLKAKYFEYSRKLIGYHEQEDSLNPHPKNTGMEPVLIGDKEKAILILEHGEKESPFSEMVGWASSFKRR